MTLKLGAYTACLHDRPLEAALEVLQSNGLTSVEVNTGGFIPSPHCHVDLLLSSAQARQDDVPYWTGFLSALAEIDPDMAVNIEHEDASYTRLDGLALAAGNLRAAAAKM
jgi:sugar phosphate isomerase/epimerase